LCCQAEANWIEWIIKIRLHIISLLISTATLLWIGFLSAGPEVETEGGTAVFRFETEMGVLYKIETSTDLENWQAHRILQGDGSTVEYSESQIGSKYFRAASLSPGSSLTGDVLQTSEGDVLIHPVDHASFVMQWNGKTIYNYPVGGGTVYTEIPKADLVLIGHSHSDHFSSSTLVSILSASGQVVVPQDVFDRLSTALQARATVLDNGESASIQGLSIGAVPAYNTYHPEGRDNGYVVTIGGKRIYMSGDTGDIAEMRALTNIDVAFLAMNLPYTMNINDAADAVREFRPKVVYPYHFRNQSGTFADLTGFTALVGADLGVEVRMRDWY